MVYRVIAADTVESLERMVSAMIDAGWQPVGGLVVANLGPSEWGTVVMYYQSLVKMKT